MLWAADKDGLLTFMSDDWTVLTGQNAGDALGTGWRNVVFEPDLEVIHSIYTAAVKAKSSFTVQYRLRGGAGNRLWVTGGAVPSFGPPNESFLGYLGSVAVIHKPSAAQRAGGVLGRFELPAVDISKSAPTLLEQAADHLLIAHSLITQDGGRSILQPLRLAMMRAAIELVHIEKKGPMH